MKGGVFGLAHAFASGLLVPLAERGVSIGMAGASRFAKAANGGGGVPSVRPDSDALAEALLPASCAASDCSAIASSRCIDVSSASRRAS